MARTIKAQLVLWQALNLCKERRHSLLLAFYPNTRHPLFPIYSDVLDNIKLCHVLQKIENNCTLGCNKSVYEINTSSLLWMPFILLRIIFGPHASLPPIAKQRMESRKKITFALHQDYQKNHNFGKKLQ